MVLEKKSLYKTGLNCVVRTQSNQQTFGTTKIPTTARTTITEAVKIKATTEATATNDNKGSSNNYSGSNKNKNYSSNNHSGSIKTSSNKNNISSICGKRL